VRGKLVEGNLAQGIEPIYDTLMAPSLDEVASEYGLIAEAARYPADFSWVSFRLHPAAKWHEGRAISSDDVIFSMEAGTLDWHTENVAKDWATGYNFPAALKRR
jgi:ABC-type oligopeptide transport system substrate-binding subunit